MTLADDLEPISCIGMCVETLEENLVIISQHLPDVGDSQEVAATKYTILAKCLRQIKECTKEALKSCQIGQDGAASNLILASQHKPLDEFNDAKISITGPDGQTTETTLDKFNQVAEAVQKDPGMVDRIWGEDSE
jgi:hypothetical protein